MFEIVTKDVTCKVVVVDPKAQEIAMTTTHPQVPGPDLWYCMGANWGGSTIKVGCIVVGARIQMRRLAGGLISTTSVESISVCDTPDEAQRMMDEAESKRPSFMTSDEQAEYEKEVGATIEKIIAEEFPADKQSEIRRIGVLFGNVPAKMVVMGLLSQAQKYSKLEEALDRLKKDWERDWVYQPPHVTGDPEFMPLNAHRWDAAFKALGLPRPGDEEPQPTVS
jgi:hypothetical protein